MRNSAIVLSSVGMEMVISLPKSVYVVVLGLPSRDASCLRRWSGDRAALSAEVPDGAAWEECR